ncbi:hypothetical protein CEUSTIGMA_g9093.t1 [Chlamydomonas eustigma]|uniref:tRNA (guanine(46)-N(7))-methyltransferase n=1 Tax=Chlamydomonas eustigma TaxID=1157962 RepID=A0A250XF06_9CHLO|nr:hypothetical protein CEUSTIGMA_g9093.t1 [Chlamydomonas eustigma]|eukprot:GAX81665.1 hypothetical protein CEUSTIGMA_g9093.t1 [Chlamydomonas eustigma]
MIEYLRGQLASRSEAFQAKHGRPARLSDIQADVVWLHDFQALKEEERKAAGKPQPGGCTIFIPRRRRYCSHAATEGMSVCSEHASLLATAYQEASQPDTLQTGTMHSSSMSELESESHHTAHLESEYHHTAYLESHLCQAEPSLGDEIKDVVFTESWGTPPKLNLQPLLPKAPYDTTIIDNKRSTEGSIIDLSAGGTQLVEVEGQALAVTGPRNVSLECEGLSISVSLVSTQADGASDGVNNNSHSAAALGAHEAVMHRSSIKRNLKRRMKHCSNPLAKQFLVPFTPPDWSKIFADATLPILLDIGCAKGRWLRSMATCPLFEAEHGRHNFLGVELFTPLVISANEWRDNAGLRNLHYLAANISFAFPALVASLPPKTVSKVCIQFPDPWRVDGKHAARRTLNTTLAQQLCHTLPEGSHLYLASDCLVTAEDMRRTMIDTGAFVLHPKHVEQCTYSSQEDEKGMIPLQDPSGDDRDIPACTSNASFISQECKRRCQWLSRRPFNTPTERDKVCEALWRPVYRTFMIKQ